MSATLRIIGSSPAVPRPNGASSCYVLRSEGVTLVLELGSGALGKLIAKHDLAQVDAVLISHMHADHFFDLVPLRYALKYAVRRRSPLSVYLPPEGSKKLHAVVSPFAPRGSFFDGIVDVAEYSPDRTLRVRDVRITFAKTRHYIDGYAMRVRMGAQTFVFSSDTAPQPALVEFARGADLFLCECALGEAGEEHGRRGHCNANEAAAMAAQAAVKHLVLTHYPASQTASRLKHAAAGAFSGRITVADDGMEIALE